MKEITASLENIHQVVDYVLTILKPNTIVFLHGDLAAGKTTLTQYIAKAKGIHTEVTSPTFSLQQCYLSEDSTNLYHYDLYRLEHEEFMQMGLYEEFEKEGLHMVEWASNELKIFLESVGYNLATIEIKPFGNKERTYRISA